MKTTKKDWSLGVQPDPEDKSAGLGTLKREHKAPSFVDQDMEDSIEPPDPAGSQSLLGYKLRPAFRVNL